MNKWEIELAKKLKGDREQAQEDAINQATFFTGIIEQVYPLVISLEGGELMYEDKEDEIIKTLIFTTRTHTKGASVICLPAEGLDAIVALDLEG